MYNIWNGNIAEISHVSRAIRADLELYRKGNSSPEEAEPHIREKFTKTSDNLGISIVVS